jgi:hypothetical protein
MRFWTGLYPEMDRAMLIDGVNTMLRVATEIFISQNPADGVQKRQKIEDQQDDEDPKP